MSDDGAADVAKPTLPIEAMSRSVSRSVSRCMQSQAYALASPRPTLQRGEG
jgi:hypothetical protein